MGDGESDMSTDPAKHDSALPVEFLEKALIAGDLSEMTPGERLLYYRETCQTLGLNALTRPFAYLRLNNRLVLYAQRDATDQLRRLHNVSVSVVSRGVESDVYVVQAHAVLPSGRSDDAIGAVSVAGLRGDALANAFMKAETKAKRRVTLSIIGLGWLDESEIETVRDAHIVSVDASTGEILDGNAAAHAIPGDDTPARTLPEQTAVAGQPRLMRTDQQVTALSRLVSKLGWDDDELYAWLRREYGCANTDVLTFVQASRAIADLQRMPVASG